MTLAPATGILTTAVLILVLGAPGLAAQAGIPDELRDPQTRSQALAGILEVVESREGPVRTLWVQGLAVAEKTSPEAGARAIEALIQAEAGDVQGAALSLARWPEGAEGHETKGDDGPALLALAARLMDLHNPEGGAELRERLLAQHPGAPEAVEARLRLARHLAALESPEDRDRARTLVEDLIVEVPDHPLAPEARRFLAELRRGS